MSRPRGTGLRSSPAWLACAFVLLGLAASAPASTILLKDGRQLQGRFGQTGGLALNPLKPTGTDTESIKFIDDELRRIFIPAFRIARVLEADTGEVPEKINIRQHVAHSGSRVQRVGPIVKVGPFDAKGHRTLTMMTDKGPLNVVQGITQITPSYAKVEGMATATQTPLIWDMRIATSSIPTETLEAVIATTIDPKSPEQRLRVVRLLLQAQRYKEAAAKLKAVLTDFPDQKQLTGKVQELRQLYARSIVNEIEVRRTAGQHAMAYSMLEGFPSQDVAGEILQQVREMRDEYQDGQKKLKKLHAELTENIEKLTDGDTRRQCEALLEEMTQELGVNTQNRMADYWRLTDDAALGPAQRLSLAFSGWLLGANRAETNLSVTLSLVKVRDLVRQYLSEPVKLEREKLFRQLQGMEAASPAQVAQLIHEMKPPLATPDPSPAKPGYYQFTVPVGVPNEPDATYYVQVPPEYDPHVSYPTVVTLNGAGTTPDQQIDWWCGSDSGKNGRLGQATRLGYIVIAVAWQKDGQQEYEFSAREHAAVLVSLRDACRRFSIDTDRVYLSGHSIGGNAAWDLGLSHPDLWAGVIPIVALAEKFCALYWENAKLVPFYFLAGELDGDKTIKNARDLDRYLTHRYDVTVTEYIGRGHEDFYEDIQSIFDWMGRRRRDFFPKQFEVSTMRTWDNYFWWFEGRDFPSRSMLEPIDWPPKRGVRPVSVSGTLTPKNGLVLNTAGVKTTVWLSPELVDFSNKVPITINGRALKSGGVQVDPDLEVLLEDVRTRADRLHPFWAKVEH